MNELIAIVVANIGGQQTNTVNARHLHAFLGVGKDFSTWIKDRIDQYGFTEGQDYTMTLLPNFGEKGQGRPTKDYHLSLSMAKELCMVERTDKGREARLYFIECERRALAPVLPDPMLAVNDPKWLRAAILGYSEKVEALEARVEAQAPKVAALELLSAASGDMCLRDAAAHLNVPERVFTQTLNTHGWIYRRPGKKGWLAHAESLRRGVLAYRCYTYRDSVDGLEKVKESVLVTPLGLTRLAELLVKWGILPGKSA